MGHELHLCCIVLLLMIVSKCKNIDRNLQRMEALAVLLIMPCVDPKYQHHQCSLHDHVLVCGAAQVMAVCCRHEQTVPHEGPWLLHIRDRVLAAYLDCTASHVTDVLTPCLQSLLQRLLDSIHESESPGSAKAAPGTLPLVHGDESLATGDERPGAFLVDGNDAENHAIHSSQLSWQQRAQTLQAPSASSENMSRAIEPNSASLAGEMSSSQSPTQSQQTPGSSQGVSFVRDADQQHGGRAHAESADIKQQVRLGLIQRLVSAAGPQKSSETALRSAEFALASAVRLQQTNARRQAAVEWVHEQLLDEGLRSEGGLHRRPLPVVQV